MLYFSVYIYIVLIITGWKNYDRSNRDYTAHDTFNKCVYIYSKPAVPTLDVYYSK